MSNGNSLPRILIIDDLFGRTHPDRRNEERANLCGQYLLEDVTSDELDKGVPQKVKEPITRVVFHRGQKPICSTVGDIVENDLDGIMQVIQKGWPEQQRDKPLWTMVLLDLCFYTGQVTTESNARTLGMPEGREGDDHPDSYFGLQILDAIRDQFPDLPVIILSSKPRGAVSREFSTKGALGFLPRDDEGSPEKLQEYIWRHGLIPDDAGEIIGHSKALFIALRAARRAATSRRNILIRGERGSGKELLARYIHRIGVPSIGRGNHPLIIVDSGTLNPELYGSEVFGHERGAFTGASRTRMGRILQADGGDLFLDEIGNIPADVQAGLLRVLEYREVVPLGANTGQSVDVRFLSATNEDIEAKAFTGGFRRDLLDRLNEGGAIFLPPLRQRLGDIFPLVEKFVREAEIANPNALERKIDPDVVKLLSSYDWPGNIRELRTCIFGAVNNYPDVEHLVPDHIQLPVPRKLPKEFVGDSQTAKPSYEVIKNSVSRRAEDLDDIVNLLSDFSFDFNKPSQLAGRLSDIQEAYARFIARYLKAVLEATSRPTPEEPDGKILIHPAMKLMTGDSSLTASQAADLIKRLLNISPEAVEPLTADSVLGEAHETALRLRPKGPKKKRKQ